MKLLFSVLLLLTISARAQQVVPLFRNDSLKTFVTMPFMLQDATFAPLGIFGMEIVQGKNACAGMIDPHIASNFLLKCTEPATVTVDVYFRQNGQMSKIVYGPLSVLKISDSGVIQPEEDEDDPYAAGRTLFQSTCMSCHQSPHDKPNKSFTQIKSAIANIGQMKSIRLTDDQIRAVSAYLNHLD